MIVVVFPIGHDLGPVQPPGAGTATEHRIRVGSATRLIRAGDPYRMWRIAHGTLPAAAEAAWTMPALAAAAGMSEDRSRGIAGELVAEGVLAEVPTSGAHAAAFARRYRIRPLLTGQGWHPDGYWALGAGGQPVALVTQLVYQVWQWSPVVNSLWQLSEVLAAGDEAGEGSGGRPSSLLTDILNGLHLLLAQHGGYLDEA